MALVTRFDHDIFISYCHADNERMLGRQGWIDTFHEVLSARLRQLLGARTEAEMPSIWRDVKLQGNDEFANELSDRLDRVALVISVLSPSYVRSKWCRDEVDMFSRAAQKNGGLRIANKNRLIKVIKTHVDRDKQPEIFEGQTGYPFYVIDKAAGHAREYSLMPGADDAQGAWAVIDDLANHVKLTLELMVQAIAQPEPVELETQPVPSGDRAALQPLPGTSQDAEALTVYLAETSFELDEDRNRVRRELESRGLKVLPDAELPLRRPDQFHAAVREAMALCDLSVHMLASGRSNVLPGETQDTVFMQHQAAARRAAEAPLSRLVWMAPGTQAAPDCPLQKDFLKAVERDPQMQQGAELLVAPVQQLMARVLDLLDKCRQDKAAALARQAELERQAVLRANAAVTASEAGDLADAQVYVIAHEDDDTLAQPIRDRLFQAGCTVWDMLVDNRATAEQIFETHKRQLTDCDAVLVCYGDAGEFWLRSQLSDVQKAVAWRSGRPMTARAVYLGPPDQPGKNRLRVQGLRLLDGRQGHADALLDPLLKDLAAAHRSAA